MENLLVGVGIAIILFSLWKDWANETTLYKEKEESRRLLRELIHAKKEVRVLLDQLETVSEKIVDEISFGLEEIKLQVSSAVENRSEKDDTNLNPDNVPEKTAASRLPKKLRLAKASSPSDVNTASLIPEKTAAPRKQKAVDNKKQKEPVIEKELSEKEPNEKQLPPKHQMVYAMAEMGYSDEDIAKQMKIGKGEVSLLLQLKRKGEEGNV